MLQSEDELHSFLCHQRRMDTILDTWHVGLPNAHPTHPSWGLTEPSTLGFTYLRDSSLSLTWTFRAPRSGRSLPDAGCTLLASLPSSYRCSQHPYCIHQSSCPPTTLGRWLPRNLSSRNSSCLFAAVPLVRPPAGAHGPVVILV